MPFITSNFAFLLRHPVSVNVTFKRIYSTIVSVGKQ